MLDSLDDRSASTTIYARQLRDVADTKAESLGYETSLSDDLSHRGAILILSKQFLKLRPVEHLWKLRRKGNILIGCFLDDPVSHRKVGYLDGLIATSTEQLRCYLEEFPEVPSFRVTHGIDTRICYPACQQTTFAAAYFGEPSNGLYLDVLQQLLAIHRTPTESSELGWSSALGNYNCHYLLRPPAPPGVIKPFTKAFVAAACGAVVIAEAGDPTAAEMLGEDYPFAVKDLSIAGVREAIAGVEDAFGGPDWALARGIMASLRREHAPGAIAEELATVLRQYL